MRTRMILNRAHMTKSNFKDQLKRQIGYLQASSELYDNGAVDEGIRIGLTLRVLFYDKPSSPSLLKHLNATGIKLLSTVGGVPRGQCELINLKLDLATETFESHPLLEKAAHKRFVFFDEWWEETLLFFTNGRKIRRVTLVKYAVHKDGGAHVDSVLPDDYVNMIEGLGWSFTRDIPGRGKKNVPLKNTQFAPFRQMAYEILNSPELISLAT